MSSYGVIVLAVLLAGCSGVSVIDMRQQAESCQGKVRFQVQMVEGEQTAKYLCEWDAPVEDW